MKHHIQLVILALLVAFFSGCSKHAPPASSGRPASWSQTSTIYINPSVPILSLHSGMTVQEVIAELGQPTLTNASGLQFASIGLFISPKAHRYGFTAPFAGRTKEGIGLGASRADVIKAYGEPSESKSPKAGFEELSYESAGIHFQIHNSKVNWIDVVANQ
jgi:hypothetical protein